MASEKRTPASVVEYLFTHANPATGGEPPPHVAWVIFENGTAFVCYPSDELPLTTSEAELRAAALAALTDLGPVQAGTPSADFNAAHLGAWFPGEFVYWVSYDHPGLATIVIASEKNDLSAGLTGRSARSADLQGQRIVDLRLFQ